MLLVQLAQGLPLLTQVRVYMEGVLTDEDNTAGMKARLGALACIEMGWRVGTQGSG
jgi:hypothetical protein